MDDALRRAHALVAAAERIVVLSGAGLSTASGIPDFRGPTGVWTTNPAAARASTLDEFLANPAVREAAWGIRATNPVWRSRPNAGHDAIVALEDQGRLLAIVTQNTDGLHQMAGSTPSRVLEMHGNVRTTRCEECAAEQPTQQVIERVAAGEADPRCRRCGGILRATAVLFGEPLPAGALDSAIDAVSTCDLLLAVGTKLTVFPVAGLVPLARDCGARIVIVNAEPTRYDATADAVVPGDIPQVLPLLCSPAA